MLNFPVCEICYTLNTENQIRAFGHLRLEGLCDRADLVDLQQQAVAGLF